MHEKEKYMRSWTDERTQEELELLEELGVIESAGEKYRLTTFGSLIPTVPNDIPLGELADWIHEQAIRIAIEDEISKMLEEGLIVPTGEIRDGEYVYKKTEFGKLIDKRIQDSRIDPRFMISDEYYELVAAHRRRGRPRASRKPVQLKLLN